MREASTLPNDIHPMPQTAAEWIGRLNAEDCSPAERAAFERWLEISPGNRAAFDRCRKIWSMPKQLAGHSEMFAKLAAKADAVPNHARSKWGAGRYRWPAALAAGMATLAIAAGWILVRESPDRTRIATAASEMRSTALPDGSTVVLNARTTISTAFTDLERRVVMSGGEAFFDVSKDPSRPFIVRVGNSEVRVVGTQFNVRESNGELEVVVRQGKVNVVPDSTVAPTASVPRVELTPGNRLRVNTSDNQVVVAQVDPERLTAWRTGMIKFDSIALSEVIEDVNRYTDKPMVIANDSLRGLPISGRFRVGDTESVRFLLRERFDVQSYVEQDRIVLR